MLRRITTQLAHRRPLHAFKPLEEFMTSSPCAIAPLEFYSASFQVIPSPDFCRSKPFSFSLSPPALTPSSKTQSNFFHLYRTFASSPHPDIDTNTHVQPTPAKQSKHLSPRSAPLPPPRRTRSHDNHGRDPILAPMTSQQGPQLPAPPSPHIPARVMKVEAVYVGSGINVYDLLSLPQCSGHYRRLHKGSVVIALTDSTISDAAETDGLPLQEPFLVATSYGAAVFFNTEADVKEAWLSLLASVSTDPLQHSDRKYTEEYSLAIVPDLPTWSYLEPECIRLLTLDLRNVQVIAQVLSQSVALDYYSSNVERTLETFRSMNLGMAESANIADINKQVLLQLVAENNIVMTEIISKLGFHERFDIAWKYAQYGRIWEYLRSELEMESRFKTLDMKLNLIQDNLKYFLEILQAKKSDSLEWTIIILIGVEICLSLYELASHIS